MPTGPTTRGLAGFEQILRTAAVQTVRFEYGQADIRLFLRVDHYEHFTELGAVVGKLYLDPIDFRGQTSSRSGRTERFSALRAEASKSDDLASRPVASSLGRAASRSAAWTDRPADGRQDDIYRLLRTRGPGGKP